MNTMQKYLGDVNRFEYQKEDDKYFYIISFTMPLISIDNTPAEFHLNNILRECGADYFKLEHNKNMSFNEAIGYVVNEIEKKANELLSYRIKSLEEARDLLNK